MPFYEYARSMNTVDVVLFTVTEDQSAEIKKPKRGPLGKPRQTLKVVLIRRSHEPHIRKLSIPGTFLNLEKDKTLLDAANRLLRDKCGLTDVFVEQMKTFGDSGRDPRGWCVTTVYYALVPPSVLEKSTADLTLAEARSLSGLPFDHDQLIAEGIARIAGKATYTTLPAMLMPKRFTMPQLEEAYEAVLGRPTNRSFFRSKMNELTVITKSGQIPFLIDTKATTKSFGGRPAVLYEAATSEIIAFPQRF